MAKLPHFSNQTNVFNVHGPGAEKSKVMLASLLRSLAELVETDQVMSADTQVDTEVGYQPAWQDEYNTLKNVSTFHQYTYHIAITPKHGAQVVIKTKPDSPEKASSTAKKSNKFPTMKQAEEAVKTNGSAFYMDLAQGYVELCKAVEAVANEVEPLLVVDGEPLAKKLRALVEKPHA